MRGPRRQNSNQSPAVTAASDSKVLGHYKSETIGSEAYVRLTNRDLNAKTETGSPGT
jgi:hypothetical protein